MEGDLWKWTNYWNGWQSRWFILEDGILSYYKSYDEVSQGCKGSLNVSSCEINVNPADNTRLDLVISGGEQYIYLRASNEKERQRWLIALGSAKTCGNNRPRRPRVSSVTSSAGLAGVAGMAGVVGVDPLAEEPTASLKTKKSELRLYCDLLMQQVHLVKGSIDLDGKVDASRLDEGASLLPQTCDMFMRTLDEVMRLSDANFVYTLSSARVGDPAAESAILHHHLAGNGVSRKNSRSSMSQERSVTPVGSQSGRLRQSSESGSNRLSPSPIQEEVKTSRSNPNEKPETITPHRGFKSVFGSYQMNSESPAVANVSPDISPNRSSPGNPMPLALDADDVDQTHRSSTSGGNSVSSFPLRTKFPKPLDNGDIHSATFLAASQGALKIYDFLNTPDFATTKEGAVKMLRQLQTKFSGNPKQFNTMERLLRDDLPNQMTSIDALTELRSHLMLIHNFLRKFLEIDDDQVSKPLLLALEITAEEVHFVALNQVRQASNSLHLNRSAFLQNFAVSTSTGNATATGNDLKLLSLLQAQLFPPLAEYLDDMEVCLMAMIKTGNLNGSKA